MPPLSVRSRCLGAARRPYVDVAVAIPRLGASAVVRLLVSTGAARTSIHWSDRQMLRTAAGGTVPPDAAFPDEDERIWIDGQPVRYGLEDAHLTFVSAEGPAVHASVRAAIALDPNPGVPSLLGRDVLGDARLDLDMPAGALTLTWER